MRGTNHDLPAMRWMLVRAQADRCCAVIALALLPMMFGCAGYPPPASQPLPNVIGARELDQDVEYLTKLNARVKDGMLTEADRERLWHAYLVRIQAEQTGQARVRFWPYPFVPPAF